MTAEQKEKLAELTRVYTARMAERELDLQPKIAALHGRGELEGAAKLEETLRSELAKLRRKLEDEKDQVRQAP